MKSYEVTQLVEVNYALNLEDDEDVYDAINTITFFVDLDGPGVDSSYFNDTSAQAVLSVSESSDEYA